MNIEEILIGTWKYRMTKAPFGFKKGKVIFFRDDDELKAKIKILGLTFHSQDLIIRGSNVILSVGIEQEQVSIETALVGDRLSGTVYVSDFTSSIELEKAGASAAESTGIAGGELPASKHPVHTLPGWLKSIAPRDKLHTFYYGWYGSSEFDGEERGWNHAVVPHKVMTDWNDRPPYPDGDDIACNYYPELGAYSSNNPEVITTHMKQIHSAGIGVAALSWWGKDSFTDGNVSTILDAAADNNLRVVFHIEPFYENARQFREHMEYCRDRYLDHPAVYRPGGLPLFYLYNPFVLEHGDWASMMIPTGAETIRGTNLDGVYIGLWTTPFDGDFTVASGFDGFYTYFVTDGFSYGSTTGNWPAMAEFARTNGLIWIPCVGPGYIDTRIRPWNEENIRVRDSGRYYEAMMKRAVDSAPDFVAVTSFNEWFEGTQIEPAVPKSVGAYTYQDFSDAGDPEFYLRKTRKLAVRYFNIPEESDE